MYQCRREVMHAPHVEPVGLLKDATTGSQVATSGVYLEIPSSPPWIKHTPLPSMPTIDKRYSAVLREVFHGGRFVVDVGEIRNRMVTQGAETMI